MRTRFRANELRRGRSRHGEPTWSQQLHDAEDLARDESRFRMLMKPVKRFVADWRASDLIG